MPDGSPAEPRYPAVDVALLLKRWGPALRTRILGDMLGGGGELCPRAARILVAPGLPESVADEIEELALERVDEPATADVAIDSADGRLTFDWLSSGERVAADSEVAVKTDRIETETLRAALAASAKRASFCIRIGARDWAAANGGGDAPLARSLARALGRSGHQALIQVGDEAGSHAGLCLDVLLTLRGRAPAEPTPGRLNLLWLISHPSEVEPDELNRYDRILVASRRYAERLRHDVRPPVEPLLQFTDPDVFYPDPHPSLRHTIAFVGNSRSVLRRIVWDALATGQPLALYGRGWERIAAEHVVAEHVPHADLRRVYSSTDVLLCDHWDDMREHGFIANRIFDALACGAFVISDDNPAIAAELPGAVTTYASVEDLCEKLGRWLSDTSRRTRVAANGRSQVLKRHTAERRSQELLTATRAASRASARQATHHVDLRS